MVVVAWVTLVFTALLLLMIMSRVFFHDWIAGERALGVVGWAALFGAVPATLLVWLVWALDPSTALAERPPAGLVLGVCGGLLLVGSLVAGVEAFRLLKIVALTDNKTNLLVTVANRLNDVEDYLRILHYNLTAEYHPPLPPETESALQERGILPIETVEYSTATDAAAGEAGAISAADVAPEPARRTPDTALVEQTEQTDGVPSTPPAGTTPSSPSTIGNDDAAAN